MSEAIIARRSGGLRLKVSKSLRTETITFNTNWTVPNAINNAFDVRIFGGGGRGASSGGGGGGWMNNATLTLTPGDNISITIGAGGNNEFHRTGGTTSFGTYLSANGGETLNGGSGGGGEYGGINGKGGRGY